MMYSTKSLIKIFVSFYLLCGFPLQANQCLCWWDNLYLGIDGGFTTGLGKAKNSIGVGRGATSNENGMSTNAIFLPGWNVGAEIGYAWCSWLRVEACYTFFQSNYNWETEFGSNAGLAATTTLFEADVNVHTAIFNAYLQLDRLFCHYCSRGCISPYIFGGVGAAWNDLHHIKEFLSPLTGPAFLLAEYHQKTQTNFSGRFGIGVLVDLICGLQLDAGIHATYVGTIETGNTLSDSEGSGRPVTPHSFKNNWLGSFDIGLNYLF